MDQYFEIARKNMVDCQIKPNKVTDVDLLDAFYKIPREAFVPLPLKKVSYTDINISIGHNRTLPDPTILSRLIQAAHIQKSDIVLDIGCGTGYSTGIMAGLANTVIGLENNKEIASDTESRLRQLGIFNVAIVTQDNICAGYAQQGPYNIILINGSIPVIPDNLKEQLAIGGRLVTVVSKKGSLGDAVLITRTSDGYETTCLFDASVPALHEFKTLQHFVF